MKRFCYIVLISTLFSCNTHNNPDSSGAIAKDTFQSIYKDTSERQKINNDNQVNPTTTAYSDSSLVNDSLPDYYDESLFASLELQFDSISKEKYEGYNTISNSNCPKSSGGFAGRTDIYTDGDCNEICEDYLVERKSGRKILLPADYDAGILGILISPSCDKFIVYSSYDGPDYDKFYAYRAEIFLFTITKDQGLKAIKPLSKYYSKDWSIEDLTWINDNSIAVKIYDEHRWGDGSHVQYKYLKTKLK